MGPNSGKPDCHLQAPRVVYRGLRVRFQFVPLGLEVVVLGMCGRVFGMEFASVFSDLVSPLLNWAALKTKCMCNRCLCHQQVDCVPLYVSLLHSAL